MTTSSRDQECYKFILFEPPNDKSSNPIWDSTIDATYVLYLEGNEDRYEQIISQLNEVNFTKNTWILHNKSYKTCKKASHVNTSPKDIVDANRKIFQHAEEQGYDSILILEDDFLFDARIVESKKDVKEIQKFVEIYPKNRPLLYYLGTLPIVQCPISLDHNMIILSCGTHGVIYNRAFRNVIMALPPSQINDWDLYMTHYNGWRYTYKIPLCYQLFTYTKNSTQWGGNSWLLHWLASQFHDFNTVILGLDHKIEPGYSFYNMVSKLLFLILLAVIVFLVWYVLRMIVSVLPRFRIR